MKFYAFLAKIYDHSTYALFWVQMIWKYAYFKTIDLFDYDESQETNSGDWLIIDWYKVKDNVHMADFSNLLLARVQ